MTPALKIAGVKIPKTLRRKSTACVRFFPLYREDRRGHTPYVHTDTVYVDYEEETIFLGVCVKFKRSHELAQAVYGEDRFWEEFYRIRVNALLRRPWAVKLIDRAHELIRRHPTQAFSLDLTHEA